MTKKIDKYLLKRPVFSPEMQTIIKKEIKKQKIQVLKAGPQKIKQLANICEAIEQRGLPDFLVCKKLPKHLGSGIFLKATAKTMAKNTFLGSYSGIVTLVAQNNPNDSLYTFAPLTNILLNRKEQEYFDPNKTFRPNRLYSLDIDAEKEGNFIRFINHSNKPNVAAYIYKIPDNSLGLIPTCLEVIYVTIKPIKPGEQVLICYDGDDGSYWKNLQIKPIPITPRSFMVDLRDRLITKN